MKLQQANRFSDAYLLYQPYTFQNMRLRGDLAAHHGRWGSRFRCPFTIATRETLTGRGSMSRRVSSNWHTLNAGWRPRCSRPWANIARAGRSCSEFATRFFRGSNAPTRRGWNCSGRGKPTSLCSWIPRQVQRDGQGVSRFAGAASAEHAGPEHRGRATDLAVTGGRWGGKQRSA